MGLAVNIVFGQLSDIVVEKLLHLPLKIFETASVSIPTYSP